MKRPILLVCNQTVSPYMAGPVAIRYWEFARVLSQYFTVTLAIPPLAQNSSSTPPPATPEFEVRFCRTATELRNLTQSAEVLVVVGEVLSLYPFLAQSDKPLVVDLYIPFLLEGLQKHATKPLAEQLRLQQGYRRVHALQLRAADLLLCPSYKLQDFWLGYLAALGRVNPYTHAADPAMTQLISVVPFGLPATPPRHDRAVMKGVYKTIGAEDKVILWGGGLWNWLDWQTMLQAMAIIAPIRPDIKLFFMGTKNPSVAGAPEMAVTEAIALSQQLGLYDKHVFFNDWVAYADRHNYLLEADIGITLHRQHLESRFSFRTRLLDYLWTGLPIIATAGDVMSAEVERGNLGRVVASGDSQAVSQAMLELLAMPNLRQDYQPQFARMRRQYEWETVMQPLIQFCHAPYRAADKPYLADLIGLENGQQSLIKKGWQTLKRAGPRGLLSEISRYLYWKRHS